MGRAGSNECSSNMKGIAEMCEAAGLLVEPSKTEGPATAIEFLGLELDSVAREIRLPRPKLEKLRAKLAEFRGRKACKKRELLSLIGSLSHACKAVQSGRAFLRRLIELASSVRKPNHFARLSVGARSDIEWWFHFAESWNGLAMMGPSKDPVTRTTVTSDASGNWGCGAWCEGQWFQLAWVDPVKESHITVKELIPIVVAAAIWGDKWAGGTVRVRCDNMAVVAIINKETSQDKEVMHLVRCLAFIRARFQFRIYAVHVPGVENTMADALSRNNRVLFMSLHPQAQQSPAPIPSELIDMLLLTRPDWTSPQWTNLWSSIFTMG